MLEGSLSEIVIKIERGELDPWPVWISLPGSLIIGKLVSHSEMIRRTTALVLRNKPVQQKAVANIVSVEAEDASKEFSHNLQNVVNAHIAGATIFHGDKTVRSPFAIIELDTVGAWGVGNFSPEK